MNLSEFLRAQPNWRIFALGILFGVVLALVDYRTPYELTLFMLYTCPILFVGWYGTRSSAIALAAISTALWWFANSHSQPFTPNIYAWAAFNRLVLLAIVAV